MQGARCLPAHDEAGEHVHDEGDVDEPGVRAHIRQIRHPELVRPLGAEVALHQIFRAVRELARGRGEGPLASGGAADPQLTHETGDGAAGDPDALSVQLAPDLAGAVDREVGGEHASDLGLQLLVAASTLRGRSGPGLVVGGGGDRQQRADRLDPELRLVFLDVGDHRF